eukprot:gene12132-16243_t
MEAAAAHLLNFSQPFDCALLDQIVLIAMDGSNPNRSAANAFLVKMKENPDMWRRADAILEVSKQQATKFFGLQVLSETINTHWKIIPQEQREGIRSYIVNKILVLSSSDESMLQNNTFLLRLNLVLVQILKQDWPHNWPTFISDIVASSNTSVSLCENNMKILKLLSEEVFDFSKDSMTTAKIKSMKESLNEEFSQIFQLCEAVLAASDKPSLVLCTLLTLQRFLTWIPLGYIFETNLVSGLISKFLPLPAYRTATIDCLTEIAALAPADIPQGYRQNIQLVLVNLIQQLDIIKLPRETNALNKAYQEGSEDDRLFVQRLALFLGTYLKSFLPFFDLNNSGVAMDNSSLLYGQVGSSTISYESIVVTSLIYMVRISEVDDEEIFKTCLEFWSHFAKELYTADVQWKTSPSAVPSSNPTALVLQQQQLNVGGNFSLLHMNNNINGSIGNNSINMLSRPKHVIYDQVLHSLRILMIDRMAKPEEVIIVEDDNGEIVREMTKDTEVIAQYKTMRETIVYLTNLNYEDTEEIMLEKLNQQVAGGLFSWNGLNTLCWAIGSISGAMGELDEKRFLVTVIKDLLRLCEEQRGKDNKAVVASNIMYIVGQYPRFLRAHWKFLKTVVNKLFEFMHEHHPGVQDMACDTFLKIAQKCKRKFMTPQVEDPQPFILTLIGDLSRHIADLQPHQVQSFYESVGTMLSDNGPAIRLARDEVMLRLMDLENTSWKNRMAEGAQNVQALLQLESIKDLTRILKINTRVCAAAGSIFIHQLSNIFLDMLNVYQLFSEQITAACVQQGPIATRLTLFKAMRGVKSEILEMLIAYLEVCKETEGGDHIFVANFMPPILSQILSDYHTSNIAARDPKVLQLFATAVAVLKGLISGEIPRIMNAIFEKTLEMITTNMQDYPEHRISFFRFLHEANKNCFYGLFSIPPDHQKLVVDSIVWALKHTERNISETGLEILLELLQNVSNTPQIAQQFYVAFLVSLIEDLFGVMTDRLHKSGFKLQASILKHLLNVANSNALLAPLYDSSATPHASIDNISFIKEHIGSLLIKHFPNLTKNQVSSFIAGLCDVSLDLNAFKQHLRDFLITIKEFESEDNSELFNEENEERLNMTRQEQWLYMSSVPGLLKPADIDIDPDL